ncbi:ABC transporter permease [Marivivens aquimaris]|uniref:ABC transporter permease n=1 Tax=Marivivens aquimaris TaxID=2774876 RepID=UPI0018826315|nr:ABC transporter permease subunit [Marivivens aquimaris]
MARLLVALLLIGPVAAGLIGVVLPAFGYFPAIGRTAFGLDAFAELFAWPGFVPLIRLSMTTGLGATALAVIGASLISAALVGTKAWRWLRTTLGPFLALPHATAAFGLAFVIAPSGLIVRLLAVPFGWDRPPDLVIINDPLGLAMILGLAMKEIPFLLLMIIAALPQSDFDRRLQVSGALGYGRIAGWFLTVWPAIYGQIRLPVYLVLAYSISVVDVAIILGPTTPPPLAVAITRLMNDPDLAMRSKAAAGALVQLGLVIGAFGIWWLVERTCRAFRNAIINAGGRLLSAEATKPLATATAYTITAMLIAGIGIAALWSVAGFWGFPNLLPDSFTLRSWTRQDALVDAGMETVLIAGAAVIAALLIALSLTYTDRKLPTWLLYAPLIVPQVTFLPGLQTLMLFAGLEAGVLPVLLVHLIFVLPYVLLTFQGASDAWDRRFAIIGAALGRSRHSIFLRLQLPMLIGPLLGALAIGFAVSVGQYLPTLLIGGGRVETLTTEAVALASGGDRRLIGVYAVAQTIAALLPFVIAAMVPAIIWRNRKGMAHG